MHKTLSSLLARQPNILVNICMKTRGISDDSALDFTIRRFIEDEARYVLPERCVALQQTPVSKILTKGAKAAKAEAGVLLPICIVDERPSILYTVRSSNLRSHRGEISFPGGKKSPEDSSLKEAALRETQEEIGLAMNLVDVLACLGPFVDRNRTLAIQASIGYIGELTLSQLVFNDNEVSEAFTVPIADLLDPNYHGYTTFRSSWRMPVFKSKHHQIWGITASITDAFLSILTFANYSQQFEFYHRDIQSTFLDDNVSAAFKQKRGVSKIRITEK